tara:strand:+ start:394 stop:609 length:216 start_codon:yes stop_codon:yes gene_type:complete
MAEDSKHWLVVQDGNSQYQISKKVVIVIAAVYTQNNNNTSAIIQLHTYAKELLSFFSLAFYRKCFTNPPVY